MNPDRIGRLLRLMNDTTLRLAIDAQRTLETMQPTLDKMTLQAAVDAQRTLETIQPTLDKMTLQAAVDAQRTLETIQPTLYKMTLQAAVDAQRTLETMQPTLDKMTLQAAVDAQRTLETIQPTLDKMALQAAADARKNFENMESVLNATINMQPTLDAVRRQLVTLDLDYVEFLDLIDRERAADTYEYHQHWRYVDWAVCTQVYLEEKINEDAPQSTKELFIKIFWLMWRIYQLNELGDAALEWLE